jgi:hypothetical protein
VKLSLLRSLSVISMIWMLALSCGEVVISSIDPVWLPGGAASSVAR